MAEITCWRCNETVEGNGHWCKDLAEVNDAVKRAHETEVLYVSDQVRSVLFERDRQIMDLQNRVQNLESILQQLRVLAQAPRDTDPTADLISTCAPEVDVAPAGAFDTLSYSQDQEGELTGEGGKRFGWAAGKLSDPGPLPDGLISVVKGYVYFNVVDLDDFREDLQEAGAKVPSYARIMNQQSRQPSGGNQGVAHLDPMPDTAFKHLYEWAEGHARKDADGWVRVDNTRAGYRLVEAGCSVKCTGIGDAKKELV